MVFRILITAHNLMRWAVLIAAAWALLRAYWGWLGRRLYTPVDKQSGLFFTIFLDLQVALGIILAVLSPYVQLAFANFGNAMKDAGLRFIVIEHIPIMLVAVVIGHLTSSWSKKAPEDAIKHRRAALGFTLVLALIIFAIPWWRPLLRLG
ncbi:MAG: hypothetical protein ACK2T2_05495 [Anaerolineales bacterium]